MSTIKDKFIVSDEVEKENLEKLIERLLPFCKITESGKVILEKENITIEDKIHISIVARYLASKVDSNISDEITSKELSENLLIPRDQINSRLKELHDSRIITKLKRGVYRAEPTRIQNFLKELEDKYSEEK